MLALTQMVRNDSSMHLCLGRQYEQREQQHERQQEQQQQQHRPHQRKIRVEGSTSSATCFMLFMLPLMSHSTSAKIRKASDAINGADHSTKAGRQ